MRHWPRRLRGRLWDVLAVIVIVLIAYKLLVVPLSLPPRDARPAPDISLVSLQARQFTLREYRGRVVFLDFWASWCQPCKTSLPMVERFARTHRNVHIEAIDVGEPRPVAAQFASAYDLQHVALDPDHLAANWFGVDGFPTMIVVDTKGMIRAKWVGFNPAIQLMMAHAEAALAVN
ncbi:MAG: TlpA family protein disulfide reductase [Candidatus Eremiobacteraeota bacterium]|nr:TlpA family protein disulfide reductase [Candidatus Eremiobacteraeota bacterium]